MIEPIHLEPLRERKAQIDKRMSDLDSRAAKIAREREELAQERQNIITTMVTLAKVYGIDVDDATVSGKTAVAASTKPDNTPTLFEMVRTVLEEISLFDDDPVEGHVIYEQIKKRWWPDAPRNSIIPSLWRFANEKRLIKEGTRYRLLPKEETPDAATSDASNSEVDLDDEIPF